MSLSLNTRFGSYLVAESIGVGGMGEVYRATDTNLKREVAIKVLPESFAQDVDRLARFQREAEVLASLNHVNIATIHGLERSSVETASVPNNSSEIETASVPQNITALVMELVEGPTLAERLEQGPIPVDEALSIAMQITEALEAAHERGIVHRDLKPANIKLRPDGLVKVLDFGIAKAMDNHAGHSSGSLSPALTTPAMTEAGVILGTAAYMSPEQARGKKVDQRADIWAFGCVLYEMLTGQPAFGAEDVSTTLARILERGVDFNELPQSLPPAVRHTLKLCLEKDVRKRIRHIGDVKLALTGAFETGAALNGAAVAALVTRARLVWKSAFAVTLLVAVTLLFPTVHHLREETPVPPPETRVELVTPSTDFPADFALSPDGRQIVFVASDDSGASQLWLRPLASTTAQPLAGTEGAIRPFWSPDSRSVGFFIGSDLKRLDIGSGAPQTLARTGGPVGVSWGTDNTLLFAPNPLSPLVRLSAAGGAMTAMTSLAPQQNDHQNPHLLPDGRRFLFTVQGTPETAGIYLGHLDGTAPVRLTPTISAGVFHPDGWLLWNRTGTLTAQRLNLEQAVLTGEPIALADGVVGRASVTSTGLIAYRTGSAAGRQLTWMDRNGTVLGTMGETDGTMQAPRLSHDGRRVAVYRSVQGNLDIWILDGARSSRFTFDAAADTFPIWSPDGSRIVFRSGRSGTSDFFHKSTDGAGQETVLVSSDQAKTPSSWSADGRFLIYHSIGPETARDLWAVPMTADPVPFIVLQTPFQERSGVLSPDGRWIAYESDESGRYEVYVRAFLTPEARATGTAAVSGQWQVSTQGGSDPVWSPDGQELYYLDPAANMSAAPLLVTGDRVEVGAPAVLFPTRIFGGGDGNSNGRQYDVAPDGRFLINTLVEDGGSAPITLIQNWNPEVVQ